MDIFLLNGPPRSGKDTAGRLLQRLLHENAPKGFSSRIVKFATAVKRAAHAIYGKPDLHPEYFENSKDVRSPWFFGKTPREVYIAVSETYFKPLHGQDIFGRLLADSLCLGACDAVIVTDSGFEAEANALIDAFPQARFHLLRTYRPGYTFAGDSRGYLADVRRFASHADVGGTLEQLEQLEQGVRAHLEYLRRAQIRPFQSGGPFLARPASLASLAPSEPA